MLVLTKIEVSGVVILGDDVSSNHLVRLEGERVVIVVVGEREDASTSGRNAETRKCN